MRRPRPFVIALLVYVACDLAIWRPGISFGLTAGVVGSSPSSDYQVTTWALEWWPWAILHGLNPLHTGLLWAPSGYPTTWMTSIPVLGVLAAPLTLLAGPLVSYNLLMLAALPASALACYALCRELCEQFWPALLGGALFGFSPYLLAQAVSQHLNLVMVWPLPLLVLIAIRYCGGRMSTRRAIATTAGLLLFLLGSSLELFATAIVLGGIVLAIALVFERELRSRLLALARCLVAALVVVLLLAAPIIWLVIGKNRPPLPFAPEQYATDAANIIVPTPVTFGGSLPFARALSRHFVGNLGEKDGYLGLPLVAVCVIAAWRDWRRRAWIAASAFVVALFLSVGPVLVVAGRTVADLPFALDRLPVLALALPARLAVYVVLAAVCLAVRWLARSGLRGWRIAIGIAIAVSFTPQLGALTGPRAEAKADRAGLPAFAWEMPHAAFGLVSVAERFAPHTTVLVLPFGGLSPASFWQAEAGMRFRIAGGYTPFAPAEAATDPLIDGFLRNSAPPLAVYRLRAYLLRTHTRIVLVCGSAPWLAIVRSATGVRPRMAAGTDVFAVNPRRLRELLAQPRIRDQRDRGVALSRSGTPLASLTAVGNSRVSAVAWLAYDWRTRHVVAQASRRSATWSQATTLSDRRFEASDLAVAVGGRRSIVAWIEAHNGAAALRVAEFRRGRWHQIAIPQAGVAVRDAVAVAPNGVATVAWTAQAGPRTVLHAVRIGANDQPSGFVSLSSAGHSVDEFSVAAASRQVVVAWRERDSTSASVMAAALPARAHTWGRPIVVSAGSRPSAPIAGNGRFGPVVVWASYGSGDAGLNAARISQRGLAGAPLTLAPVRPRQRIATPSLTATTGGVLVAWCAEVRHHSALHVALITATRIDRYPHPRGSCARSLPHLLTLGARALLSSSGTPPRLYLLTRHLRCARLDAVHLGGAYSLLASPSGIEAVTGGGRATSTVVIHQLRSLERDSETCASNGGP